MYGGDAIDNEAIFQALDTAMDGIAILNADDEFVYVNQEHADLYGYETPAELEGESWTVLYDDTEQARFEEDVFAELSETGAWRGRALGRRTDGEQFEQELTLSRLDGGGLVCTVRDITDEVEQKRQLETLNYATSELLTTSTETEVAEVAVEIADEVLNHTLAACWRYEPDEDCLRPLAATGAVESMASRTGGSVPDFGSGSYEMEVYKRGEPVLVDDYQSLDAPATDAPLRTVLMLPLGEYGVLHVGSVNRTHITETEQMLMEILARHAEAAFGRARRETQLKERQELLQRQKNRLKRLSETLSHDIRNPLQVASGRLEMLRTDTDSPHAETIGEMLDRIDQLITDALVLAQTEGVVEQRTSVPLDEIVDQAVETVETESATVTVVGSLGTVNANRSRLQRLFENLLSNAVEHVGPTVTVKIGPLSESKGFYVADDGPGIPEAERERVLEYGYSTTDDGTGLGLGIVSEVAKAHGWDVTVTNSASGGTRFEITDVDSVA